MPLEKIGGPDYGNDKDCRDPDHNPPNMLVLEPGVYRHTCPSCGKGFIFRVPPGPRLGPGEKDWNSKDLADAMLGGSVGGHGEDKDRRK